MTDGYIWAVIVGMAVANYTLRAVPVLLLSRVQLPKQIHRFLSFIPVSVMAALLVGEVLRPDGQWLAPLANPFLLASFPTALVYHTTRSFLGTTVAGVLFFLVFRALVG